VLVLDAPSLTLGHGIPRKQMSSRDQRRRIFYDCEINTGIPASGPIDESLVLSIREEGLLRGYVHETRLRVVRHRLPVVSAKRTRLSKVHRFFVSGSRIFHRPTGFFIDPLCPSEPSVSLRRD